MKNNIFFLIMTSLMLVSCSRSDVISFDGETMGTYYTITYTGKDRGVALKQGVDSILKYLSYEFSVFDTTSLLVQINNNKMDTLNEDFIRLITVSQQVSCETNGAFDITIAPLVSAWGFGRDSVRHHLLQAETDSIKLFTGYEKIKVVDGKLIKQDSRMSLNFNAIAKGYAVDKVSGFLSENGCKNHIVDIGGEIVARGNKNGIPWKIGIQIPTETKDGAVDAEYTFQFKDRAVATSGNYRSYVEENGVRYSHIINPVTAQPTRSSLLSVTVIADDCMTADAYATAFMVMGIEDALKLLKKQPLMAAYFIYDENGKFKTVQTDNFPAN